MDQLIISVILAILAAIVLGQVLKGILRLIALTLLGLALVWLSVAFGNPDGGQSLANWFTPNEASSNRVDAGQIKTELVDPSPGETNREINGETDSEINSETNGWLGWIFGSDQSDRDNSQSTAQSPEDPFSGSDARAGAITGETLDGDLPNGNESNGTSDETLFSGSGNDFNGSGDRFYPPASTGPSGSAGPLTSGSNPPPSKSRPIYGLW